MLRNNTTYTCVRIVVLILTLMIFSEQSIAQNQVNIHRLAGTCYYTYSDVSGWTPQDSTRLSYPGFENDLEYQPIPRYHMVMYDKIPVTDPEETYFENGFYTGGSNFLITIYNDQHYDTLFRYMHEYGPLNVWESNGFDARTYDGNSLLRDEHHYEDWNPIDSVVSIFNYNDVNQVTSMYHLEFNYYYLNIDTISTWEFQYADNKLSQVKNQYLYYDEMLPGWEKYIEYNSLDQVKSETEYIYYDPAQMSAGTRYFYDYYADGRLHYIYTQRQSDGAWYDVGEEEFGYDNGIPSFYYAWARSMDTTDLLSFTAWDTTYMINYYHTGNLIDSVIQRSNEYTGDLKTMNKEYFTYENDLLTLYSLYDYSWTRYLTQHFFTYDTAGQLVKTRIEYSDTLYNQYTVTERLYSYDTYGNKIVYECWQGSNSAGIGSIITEPQSRTTYTYALQDIAGSVDEALFMHVYPSPANSEITVQVGTLQEADATIEISVFQPSGALIFSQSAPIPMNAAFQIDCSRWASGVYVVRVNNASHAVHQSIVIY